MSTEEKERTDIQDRGQQENTVAPSPRSQDAAVTSYTTITQQHFTLSIISSSADTKQQDTSQHTGPSRKRLVTQLSPCSQNAILPNTLQQNRSFAIQEPRKAG